MKKILIVLACVCAMLTTAFAGDEEVTVKVSVAGLNNSALVKKAEQEAKKMAVRKYLQVQDDKLEDKILDEAVAAYTKFIVGDPSEDSRKYAGGTLTAEYTVEIDQKAIAQFLSSHGHDNNKGADGAAVRLFVMEEVPDAGQMEFGDDVSKYFFKRYNLFQRKIRDQIVKNVNGYGFDVVLLEDDENYEDMKKTDPVLVGVSYNINGDTRGFTATPGFLRTVQENNPDAIALYYRIDSLTLDHGMITVSVALSLKNLANSKTVSIGSGSFQMQESSTAADVVTRKFGECAEQAIGKVLKANDEGDGNAGQKLTKMITSLRNAAKQPKGPMKLVINCSNVDGKIKIRVRNTVKKQLIAAGLTKETKVVKDSLSCVVTPSKDYGDLDDVWGKVSEILGEVLGDDANITDNWAKKSGATLTVTISPTNE